MAIANADVTVTTTWTEISASDTGDFVFHNEGLKHPVPPTLGSAGSTAIRWAFSPTGVAPTSRGNVVYPGDFFSRGSVVGFVWVKVDASTGTVLAQKAE